MRAWQVSVQRYVQPCPFLSFKRSVAVRRKQFWITMASLSPWYKIISSMHAKSCKPLQSCDGSSAKACWECAEKPTSIAEKCWSTRETWIRQSRSLLKTMQHSRHSVYDIRYIGTTLCFSPCKSCTVTYVTYMDVPPLPRLVNCKKGHLSFPSNAVAALWTFIALLEERKIKKTHENTNAIGIEWSLKVGNACEGIVASFHRFSMSLFYFSTIIYHFLYDTFVFLSFPYYVLQCPSLYVSNSFPLHSFRFNLVPWIYTYCLKFQTFVILHSFPFTSFTMLLLCIHVLSIYVGFLSFSFVSFHWTV